MRACVFISVRSNAGHAPTLIKRQVRRGPVTWEPYRWGRYWFEQISKARRKVAPMSSGELSVDTKFTVSGIWAMDSALARQLEPWAFFRRVDQESYFANHCPHCNALQDDLYLHSEPDQPFFSVPRAPPGTIELTPLVGRIQLSGDESFEV